MNAATRHAIVVGAGPTGLAAAEVLAEAGWRVSVFERMPNPARKFLLAGRGGLNLTHAEPLDAFLDRYSAARPHLEPAIRAFTPSDLRAWAASLGVETFIGSSGRVFPKQMKASPLLRAWLARLSALSVTFVPRTRWTGWTADALTFDTPDGAQTLSPDAAVFALGGASWPRLGSDGSWTDAFRARGAAITPLQPANSGFVVNWSEIFRERFAGEPLKGISLRAGDRVVRGEAMIAGYGIEGGAIYALGALLRDAITAHGETTIELDLAPDLTIETIAARLVGSRKDSTSNRLRRAGLSPVAAGLLRESMEGPSLPSDATQLARRIKAVRITLTGASGLDRAISTAGGLMWDSITPDYALRSDPRTFVAGEMLDWEAPTGGYLLQACMATGRAAARGVLARG